MNKKSLNILKTSLIAVFLVLLANPAQAAGEITIKNFSLSPTTVPNNTGSTEFQMKFGVTVNVRQFSSTCGSDSSSFYWYVYEDVWGPVNTIRAQGNKTFSRNSGNIEADINQSVTIDTRGANLNLNFDVDYFGTIYCTNEFAIPSLASSSVIKVTFGSVANKKWACVDAKNKYACSPLNLTNCSDVPACAGKPCLQIGSNLCGKDAGDGVGKKYSCNSDRQCVQDTNGTYTTSNCDNKCGDGGGGRTTVFKIDNPIEADNLIQLLDVIATWLFNIAIPITVAMIVYAGIVFLVSRGDTAKVAQAKKILLYAVVGFTIIMIGKGFITLIESILNLGKSA